MINFIRKIVRKINNSDRIKSDNDNIRLLVGTLLSRNIEQSQSLWDAEFKVFSQFGF